MEALSRIVYRLVTVSRSYQPQDRKDLPVSWTICLAPRSIRPPGTQVWRSLSQTIRAGRQEGAIEFELVDRVEARGQARCPNGVVRTDYARSAAARRAVIQRCAGRCENKHCTGMPPDRNQRGEPILEVDHVQDLALKGADHPTNMIALCSNCHAVKTRGSERARWQREFALIAQTAHAAALE